MNIERLRKVIASYNYKYIIVFKVTKYVYTSLLNSEYGSCFAFSVPSATSMYTQLLKSNRRIDSAHPPVHLSSVHAYFNFKPDSQGQIFQ